MTKEKDYGGGFAGNEIAMTSHLEIFIASLRLHVLVIKIVIGL